MMDSQKRKNDIPKDTIHKKRRGKPPTSITQIPIATSQTIARIGFQFPYTSSNDPLCTSPPPPAPLPPLPQHKDILSSFDFFMLPSNWPIYNRTCNENSTQISPTLSSLLPSSPSLSRIAELLGLLKAENNGNSCPSATCYICVPSTTTKKQQRIILVLEPPPNQSPSALPSFSSFIQQVMDTMAPIKDLDIAVKIDVETNEGVDKEWQVWSTINESCHFPPKLLVALEIKSASFSHEAIRNRWKGENVKMVLFSTSLLASTTKFPQPLKDLLSHFAKFVKCFVVQGQLPEPDDAEGISNFGKFHKYLAMRVVNRNKVYGLESNFLEPYLDKLQIPLQPLEENLSPEVYNVFEKCPVKYRKYQDAIYLSLRAREMVAGKRVVVMVVGAGRGPLVLQTIVASQRARRPVKIYALDKNPHAIKALQELQWRKQWEPDEVVIVDADMRFWEPPEKADILVSELLGSFGDNELSPECLDAAQRFLAEDGISIPFQYNSFLAPISSSILYNEVLNIVHHVTAINQTSTTSTTTTTTTISNELNIINTTQQHIGHSLDPSLNLHDKCSSETITTTESTSQSIANDVTNNLYLNNHSPHDDNINSNDIHNNNNINNNNTNLNNSNNHNTTNTEASPATQVRQIAGIPPEYYFEVGYVVKLDKVLFLDDPRKCFTFSHPNREACVIDNSRHTQIWFQPKMDGLLHGFAGFFEALLHQKIAFSTNPPNNDHNLVAWFPMYFPLKNPIMVYKGTPVEVNFWRRCSPSKVWYEWCIGSPEDPSVFIHNSNGRAYCMKL